MGRGAQLQRLANRRDWRRLHAYWFSYLPGRQDLAVDVSGRVTGGKDREDDRHLWRAVRPAGLAVEVGGAHYLGSTTWSIHELDPLTRAGSYHRPSSAAAACWGPEVNFPLGAPSSARDFGDRRHDQLSRRSRAAPVESCRISRKELR